MSMAAKVGMVAGMRIQVYAARTKNKRYQPKDYDRMISDRAIERASVDWSGCVFEVIWFGW